ncbi:hypothetical protein MRS44_005108 [Fusarium solani]|uniref:uncharacterized protein n=1 Tax=Fusarium solani TaxID=169388 RepID=UPI0032C47B93|nr:hypothetical protein MRS44_005108 [Fusarium solani]
MGTPVPLPQKTTAEPRYVPLKVQSISCKRRGPRVPNIGRRLGNVPEVERSPVVEEEEEQQPQQPPTNPPAWRDAAVLGRLQNHVTASHRGDPFTLTRLSRIIAEGLSASIKSELPDLSLGNITSHCIDLYVRFTFPTAPLIHEPTVRKDASIFFSDATVDPFETDGEYQQIARMRAFALITSLCAMVASVMPESLLPYRDHLARPFLSASREMLSCFEIHDLDSPTAASLTIRMFQSVAMQHITGKANVAWHIHGHATLIAQRLRLYSERSIEKYDTLEGQLLRLNFWHLYSSDMTAAALRARPFTLHETLFDEALSVKSEGVHNVSLLDPASTLNDATFEPQLLIGFHLIRRISSEASELLFGIRAYQRQRIEASRALLLRQYMEFMSLLDDLPPWLRLSNIFSSLRNSDANAAHEPSFWVQRSTILVSYHCLRLVILQECIESEAYEIAGLDGHSPALLFKKMEMVQDFMRTLEDIPLLYLQVKGEPHVERMRRVGAILLEFIQVVEDEHLQSRAKALLRRLLDTLAKLDSKACEDLCPLGTVE